MRFRNFLLAVFFLPLIGTAQNVGIGEPNPGSKLSVKGGLSVGAAYSSQYAPDGNLIIEKGLGIGTTTIDPNVVLDIRSTSKGIKLPTMTSAQKNAMVNPPAGLLVFDSDSSGFSYFNGSNWLNFLLTGPSGPVGQAATLLNNISGSGGGGYSGTSTSLLTVGTGTKVVTTQSGLSYAAGDRVRVYNSSTKYMEGTVTTYLLGVLTVSVDRAVGSGTALTWTVGLVGEEGATGATGATGPTGAAGSNGTNGTNGTNGATILTGSTGPTGGQGSTNDFYINSTNGTFYKKTNSTTWTSQGSLKGVTGSTGVTGATGTNGTTGATGATGPTGSITSGSSAGNTPYWNGTSWVMNTSNIYNNGANVGIGTTSPAYKLDVSGTGRFTGALKIGAYTLPAADGAANSFLTTNGSGTASWSSTIPGVSTYVGDQYTAGGSASANQSYTHTYSSGIVVGKKYRLSLQTFASKTNGSIQADVSASITGATTTWGDITKVGRQNYAMATNEIYIFESWIVVTATSTTLSITFNGTFSGPGNPTFYDISSIVEQLN